jgi:tetratricopeptide (TPR) repeat protein
MNKIQFLILLLILTGCGFSSGQYQDILKAQELLEEQEYEKATIIYKNILQRKPSKTIQIKISFQLGEIYSIYLGEYEDSIHYFQEIIKESNEPLWQVKALEKIGHINFENIRDYKSSKIAYNKLIKFVPKLEKSNFYTYRKALSHFYLKEYKLAIKLFKELAKDEKNKLGIESYYYIGLTNFYIQNWDLAIQNFKKYLSLETHKTKIIKTKFMIANSYESSEKLKEAYNIYYSLLGEYPNPAVIKNRLNSLYKRRVSRKR